LSGEVPSVNEESERGILKANGGEARLVQLSKGRARGNVVTVHGINASPDSVKSLSQNSANKGKSVHTLVYDDRKTGLDKTSTEFATALAKLQAQSPGQPLTIRAHSLGGRIAVDALRKMKDSGVLGDSKVELEMTNPVIGGLDSANSAKFAPGIVAPLIPGVAPGKDMGTNSEFQQRLETTQLPKNVKTTTYVGTNDHLVKTEDPHFKAVQDGLNGKVVSVPNEDHDATIEAVDRRTR
jgi:triacylglycerol esterase/lipase EstA (alpha/beta hydrolase family)